MLNTFKQFAFAVTGASILTFGIGSLEASAANLVTNGSFEDGGSQNILVGVGSNKINGWAINQGNVNLHSGYWNALGSAISDQSYSYNSVDLDGSGGEVGAFSQVINTVVGQAYKLSFAMAGNYYDFQDIARRMEVFWGAKSLGIFTHTFNGSQTNVDWNPYEIEVIGSGSDELKFVSLSGINAGYGAVVDDVSVEVSESVPEPSSLVGLIAIATLGGGSLLKRKQLQEKSFFSSYQVRSIAQNKNFFTSTTSR